jgi:hypothetical protein
MPARKTTHQTVLLDICDTPIVFQDRDPATPRMMLFLFLLLYPLAVHLLLSVDVHIAFSSLRLLFYMSMVALFGTRVVFFHLMLLSMWLLVEYLLFCYW